MIWSLRHSPCRILSSRARFEWEEAIAQRKAAGVARWLIEKRSRILEAGSRIVEIKGEFPGEVTITANRKALLRCLGPRPQEGRLV